MHGEPSRSQPRHLAQCCIDACLPTRTSGAKMGEHVGVEPDVDNFFGRHLHRPSNLGLTNDTPTFADLGTIEPIAIQGWSVIGINPSARGSTLLRRHARTSGK